MFNLLLKVLKSTKEIPSLCELEVVYKRAISQLSVCERRNYCERLLKRTELDLQYTQCREDIKKRNVLKETTTKELNSIKQE